MESTKNRVALASKLEFLQSFGLLASLASVCSSCLVQLKQSLWVSARWECAARLTHDSWCSPTTAPRVRRRQRQQAPNHLGTSPEQGTDNIRVEMHGKGHAPNPL